MKAAFLEIRSWTDSGVVWAEHWYGSLYFGDKRVDVHYVLNEVEAKKLNKADNLLGRGILSYNVGEETSRFLSKEKLVKEAIKLFNQDPHGYDILLEGEHYVLDPMKMLVGPEILLKEANQIWKQFESFDGWNCKREEEKEVKEICDQWDILVGREKCF